MIGVLLLAGELAFATGSHAPALSHPVTEDFSTFLESADHVLAPVYFRSATTDACHGFYAHLYGRPYLDVRFALGYMDAPTNEGPVVVDGTEYGMSYALDGHARTAFTTWIQRPCEKSRQLCGFGETDDPDLYVKQATDRHPEVRLRVTHSSAAPSLDRNVEGGDHHALQAYFTQRSEENFLGGLGEADAVFYVGHARGGGGPDFAPPVLMRDGRVNYDGYYRRVKPGVKKFLSFLREAERPPTVIGLLACKATELFVDRFQLESIAPQSLFVTGPSLIGYKANFLATIVVLDSLLNGRCLTEIRAMLDRVETYSGVVKETAQPLSQIISFDGIAPVN